MKYYYNGGSIFEALALSNDILKNCTPEFYMDEEGILRIDYKLLAESVCSYLVDKSESFPNDCEIHWFTFDNENDAMYALVTRKDNCIYIGVSKKITQCWLRFALCKEITNLYVDWEFSKIPKDFQHRTKYEINEFEEQLRNANKGQRILSIDKSETDEFPQSFNSEVLAYIITSDLFFNLKYKKELLSEYNQITSGQSTYFDIANKYKCPEFVTTQYLEDIVTMSIDYFENHPV
ncbi:MAG: hypothetical protein LBS25_06370 [Candidatus Symbiothrix sp.]|jgi:hypothetical protein|nr:hypothetical protein [Candidatus Symbiothrix sp.]